MSAPSRTFDRLARSYRLLEFVAFGRDLERARFCFADRLRDARSVLLLGEGDGRFLARLVTIAPAARIHCVDISAAMLACAADRLPPAARDRVTFEQADVSSFAWPSARYDAVTTLFFLDCFGPAQVTDIVAGVATALQPQAQWLFADFVMPPRGLPRVRARAWLAMLYTFFRWQTGLSVRALPPSEAIIKAAGFAPVAQQELQAGLLRSVVFNRAAGPVAGPQIPPESP
jgi:ubiquinone/menaquinone biosynthesis C-methylase UbiE